MTKIEITQADLCEAVQLWFAQKFNWQAPVPKVFSVGLLPSTHNTERVVVTVEATEVLPALPG